MVDYIFCFATGIRQLKKNIGIYYKKGLENKIDELELKNKWFGVLSRRGFSLDIVKKVFEIKDIEKANLILEDNL